MRKTSLIWGLLWRTTLAYGLFQSASLWTASPYFAANEALFKFRATFTDWLFAAILLLFIALSGRHPIKFIFGGRLNLNEDAWRVIHIALIFIFVLLGLLNFIVATSMSTDSWVTYKLLWGPGIYLFFMALLAVWVGNRALRKRDYE